MFCNYILVVLLFSLMKKVTKKLRLMPALLEKLTLGGLKSPKLLPSVVKQGYFYVLLTCFSAHRPRSIRVARMNVSIRTIADKYN